MPFFALINCLCAVLLCMGPLAFASEQAGALRREAAPVSPAMLELLATPLPPDPTQAMHWPGALAAWGHDREAGLLRQHLLFAWLQQLQGLATPQGLSVAQGIEAGRAYFSARLASEGGPIWQTIVRQHLRMVLPTASVPIPEEIDNLAADLTEESPGFWAHRLPDKAVRGLFLLASVHNSNAGTMALNPFDLRLGDGSRGHHMSWHCQPLRNRPLLPMVGGDRTQWLCRSNDLPVLLKDQTLAGALAQGHTQDDWRIDARDFGYESQRNRLVQVLAQPRQAELNAFLARNASCERQGNCAVAQPPKQRQAPLVTGAQTAPASARPATPASSGAWGWLVWVGVVLAAVAAYALVATYVGNLAAAMLVLVVSGYFAVTAIRQLWSANWADSWGGLIVIPLSAMLAVGPFILASLAFGVYRLVVDPAARRRASVSFWHFMIAVAVWLALHLLSLMLDGG